MAGQIPTKGAPGQKTTVTKKTATAPKKTAGKTVAKVDKDKLPTDLTKAKATALTGRIKTGLAANWKLLAEAAEGRAYKAMGYKNWKEWMDTELSGVPVLLMPKAQRQEAVKELNEKGFSTRAIADITGSPKSTVDRDIQALKGEEPTVPNGTVPEGDDNVIDIPDHDVTEMPDGTDEFTPEGTSEPAPQINRDDRQMDTTNIGRKPTVVNVVSAARQIAKDLESVRIRIDSLFTRDDYEENKVDVQGTLETAVGDFIDTLVEEMGDLVRDRLPEPEPAV